MLLAICASLCCYVQSGELRVYAIVWDAPSWYFHVLTSVMAQCFSYEAEIVSFT
jgi:hypothetical protein